MEERKLACAHVPLLPIIAYTGIVLLHRETTPLLHAPFLLHGFNSPSTSTLLAVFISAAKKLWKQTDIVERELPAYGCLLSSINIGDIVVFFSYSLPGDKRDSILS